MSGGLKVAGVTGWPIHHSLSPLLHNYWLQKSGIQGAYVHFSVRPDEALYAFKSLKQTSLLGLNVTLPLKRAAFLSADEHTSDAHKLGVANCLYKRGGKLIAHNTDMEGFAAPLLKKLTPNALRSTRCVLIGAGGASRAVIGALLALGVPEICIVNRTDEKAQRLVEAINIPSLYMLPWAEREAAMLGAHLIVNASAAGMTGKPALNISLASAPSDALVYDLIYTPLMTPLMKTARARGLEIIGGLDMLIAQARPSFRLFFGQEPPSANPSHVLKARLEPL